MTTTTEVIAKLAAQPPAVLAGLMLLLPRVCKCGAEMIIRTSKATENGSRIARLKCNCCGATKKLIEKML